MKAFLSIILLLTFGACVWGNTPEGFTPEQIAKWKEAAENGDAEALGFTHFIQWLFYEF
jgi:hypothetical protein